MQHPSISCILPQTPIFTMVVLLLEPPQIPQASANNSATIRCTPPSLCPKALPLSESKHQLVHWRAQQDVHLQAAYTSISPPTRWCTTVLSLPAPCDQWKHKRYPVAKSQRRVSSQTAPISRQAFSLPVPGLTTALQCFRAVLSGQ